MVKKILLVFSLLMATMTSFGSQIPVDLQTGYIDPNEGKTTLRPKVPMRPPVVCIEDYTLSFSAGHADYELTIRDEDDNVVYTTPVWSAQTEVVLPSTLSGDYQIELITGNWMFTGYIAL